MANNKIYILIFSLLFLILSCSQKKEIKKDEVQTYQKEGVSFFLPSGWKVKQDYYKDEDRYLELDKYYNYKVESTMAISIYKQKLSTDSILSNQIKQLQFVYQKVNFKILSENIKAKLGKFNIITTFYEADDTKNKVYGQVGMIQGGEKTISVQIVENKQNADMSDYDLIFNSFTIK